MRKQNKTDELIKSRNGPKMREVSSRKWGRLQWEGCMGKVSLESGVEERKSDGW